VGFESTDFFPLGQTSLSGLAQLKRLFFRNYAHEPRYTIHCIVLVVSPLLIVAQDIIVEDRMSSDIKQ